MDVAFGRIAGLQASPREGRESLTKADVDFGSWRSVSRAIVCSRAMPYVAGEPAVADDVRDQDRRELSGLAYSSGIPALRRPSKYRSNVST